MFELLGKSVQWVVVVSVLWMFLFIRTANLLIWERFVSATVSAGLAFGLSEDLSLIIGGSDVATAIAIMVFAPMLLGLALNIGGDEDYAKRVLKAWVEKRLGVEVKDDEKS